MTVSTRFALVTLLLGAVTASPASAARHAHHAAAPTHRAAGPAAPALNEAVLKAEILLARAGFSPGAIDGRDGDNYQHALHAFQQINGLRPGKLDAATWARLASVSPEPPLTEYTIQPQDTAGPFVERIPQDFEQMAVLPRLSYRSPRQLLAERFHMSEDLLAALNKGKDFAQPGTIVTVANIAATGQDAAVAGNTAGPESTGSSSEPARHAGARRATVSASAKESGGFVVVDKQQHAVLVYGPDKRLIAFYPASIGSAEKPAPSGTLQVQKIAQNPSYTYNPAYGFRGQKATQPVEIAPGPNNPVGLVWIGLSLPGYGIHGTPEPDKVGKTQSHGCVRLTNWDALALSKLVRKGTPVTFIG